MVRISVELPDEVAEALGRLADSLASTPETLLAAAARDMTGREDAAAPFDARFEALRADKDAFAAYLAPALADVAAGRVVDGDVVFAEMDAIVAAALARKAG